MARLGRIWGGAIVVNSRFSIGLIATTLLLPTTAFATDRTFLMGSFDDIVIVGDMQVTINTGKAPSAKASGDKRVLDSLRLDRSGNVMTVRLQNIINKDKSQPITQPLVITLTNRQVHAIALRGNAKVLVTEMRQVAEAKIGIDGGGEIRVGNVVTNALDASISGNGSIIISGGTARLTKVDLMGNSVFDAAAMTTQQLKLSQNGNATSSATIEERADINNVGAGNINIGGKGLCFIRKAGNAAIVCARTGKE